MGKNKMRGDRSGTAPAKTETRVVHPPVRRTLAKKTLEPIRTETRVPGDGGVLIKILSSAFED
jgi:hypothetical protein